MNNDHITLKWLTLYYAPGLSAQALTQLHLQLKTPCKIISYLLDHPQTPDCTRSALRHPEQSKLDYDMAWQQQPNHYIIHRDSPFYPELLQQIATPPPILYLQGNPNLLATPQIAIVGSRKATPFGINHATEFAYELSNNGYTITSGLAVGIDTAAHQGALQAQQPTIAILGSGLHSIYPKKNTSLAEKIAEKGGLISQFPLKSAPCKHNFPIRNHLISGMSLSTLVIEAGLNSGSLITADCALNQGKDVFALPGSIRCTNAKGTHKLIKEGAYLIDNTTEIISIMNNNSLIYHTKTCKNNPVELDQQHHNLLECVDFAVTSMEKIVCLGDVNIDTASEMLLNLELSGHVTRVTGGYLRLK